MRKLRLAILDLYDGEPNQGMGAIKGIIDRYESEVEWQVFDVRGAAAVPDMSFDIFISTGGPGNPVEGDGVWDAAFFNWLDEVWAWNTLEKGSKKYVFFICHSFQMACHHLDIGTVTRRRTRSFGTFPVHKIGEGMTDPFLNNLPNPFWVADFRYYQVLRPNMMRVKELGIQLIALEKFRSYIPLERAIMAIRFSNEIFGTQFHPEAFPKGMLKAFQQEERRQDMIEHHSEEKYDRMIEDLEDPDKILRTYKTILPSFLEQAIKSLKMVEVNV